MGQKQVVSQPGPLLRDCERMLRDRPFCPPFWLSNGHLQTLAGSVLKRNLSWGWENLEKYYLDLPDGSCVRADCGWQARSAPSLVAVHGMGGSSGSTYMQGLSHKAYRESWNAVLLNLYNCNQALQRPKIFHSGSSLEVGEILKELVAKRNLDELFLVGVSMGGNIVLKLMAEWGSDPPIHVRTAAVISPLVDLTISWKVLEKASNFVFQNHFVKKFKKLVRKHSLRLSPFVDVDALLRIRTIREFDELLTAPLGGFRDAFDYYEKASALPHLKDIRVPTLLLHARDDPLLPWEPFVLPAVRSNSSLLIHLTRRGGHAGFLEKNDQGDIDRRWAENRVIDFFRLASRLKTH